jgi:hypothetical protein
MFFFPCPFVSLTSLLLMLLKTNIATLNIEMYFTVTPLQNLLNSTYWTERVIVIFYMFCSTYLHNRTVRILTAEYSQEETYLTTDALFQPNIARRLAIYFLHNMIKRRGYQYFLRDLSNNSLPLSLKNYLKTTHYST